MFDFAEFQIVQILQTILILLIKASVRTVTVTTAYYLVQNI